MACNEGYYKFINGKRYGPYKRNRPTRKFTPEDVARIAKYVANNETEKGLNGGLIVLAAVISALGLGYMICRSARFLSSYMALLKLFERITLLLAVAKVIDVIVDILLKIKRLPMPPQARWFLALIIVVLSLVGKVFEHIETLLKDYLLVEQTNDFISELCTAIGGVIDTTGTFSDVENALITMSKKAKNAYENGKDNAGSFMAWLDSGSDDFFSYVNDWIKDKR